jgi:hypothetical protein
VSPPSWPSEGFPKGFQFGGPPPFPPLPTSPRPYRRRTPSTEAPASEATEQPAPVPTPTVNVNNVVINVNVAVVHPQLVPELGSGADEGLVLQGHVVPPRRPGGLRALVVRAWRWTWRTEDEAARIAGRGVRS